MSSTERTEHTARYGLGTYVTGYLVSLYLTFTAYWLVKHQNLSRDTLIGAVAGLAIVQFVVQAFCFLHLGTERKPRWKLVVFLFMLGVVLILVFGSIWIMNSLNYRHALTPEQINQYLKTQDAL